tara:strand:+ start:73794 stop:73994 length:201 start_codon:yes stop_codon:yes gene_type:complete
LAQKHRFKPFIIVLWWAISVNQAWMVAMISDDHQWAILHNSGRRLVRQETLLQCSRRKEKNHAITS